MDRFNRRRNAAARSLVFKTLRNAIRAAQAVDAEADSTDLQPGQMRLYPNYMPALTPGLYGIVAKQQIDTTRDSTSEHLEVANTSLESMGTLNPVIPQQFEVFVSPFSIDPKKVDSYYPPDGFADEERVLPHIVFNDPHIPWDRPSNFSFNPEVQLPPSFIPPWLALAVFDPSELALTEEDARVLGVPSFDANHLPSSGAYGMTVRQYLTGISSRVQYGDQTEYLLLRNAEAPCSIIFPTKARAIQIFSPSTKFVLMSHVREINTVGMPDAGVEEKGLYSVCISHVTGVGESPPAAAQPAQATPKTRIVHLVSIENIDFSFDPDDDSSAGRIGLVSLFSWTYLCVPPNPINFKDTMLNLTKNMQEMKPPQETLDAIASDRANPKLERAAEKLYERLNLGYSIGRWRAATGEETIAFFRGPLTPTATPGQPSTDAAWSSASNTGKDYQILDRDLGVMDVGYSSAWQLGKLLAIQDSVFNSALLRFRSLVYKRAAGDSRTAVNAIRLGADVIDDLQQAFRAIEHLQINHGTAPIRNILGVTDKVKTSLRHPEVLPTFLHAIAAATDAQATATSSEGEQIYSDYDLGAASNSDWEIIHKWISDKLFLADIPAHYLITDPTHLPSEALRFFYIDAAWLDCLIDGALSVANHFEPVDDTVRRRIKQVYNVFLQTPERLTGIKPPVPRYGFILRSSLIKIMPDIRITVKCRILDGNNEWAEDMLRKPLVRLTRMDDYTIFALLDCLPQEIWHIRFAQPPHQQRYVAGEQLFPTQIHRVRRLYSEGAPLATDEFGAWEMIEDADIPAGVDRSRWYDEETRSLDVFTMYRDLLQILPFADTASSFAFNRLIPADSTIMALELNDSSYQIDVLPPQESGPVDSLPDRQLWVGQEPHSANNNPVPRPHAWLSSTKDARQARRLNQRKLASMTTAPVIGSLERLTARLTVTPTSRGAPRALATTPPSLSRAPMMLPAHSLPSTLAAVSTTMANYLVTAHMANVRAPPLPSTDPEPVYASTYFVPTGQVVDLLFRVYLDPSRPALPSTTMLGSITLSIPLSPPEPLLTDISQLEAKMVYNLRLHPLLSVSSDSSVLLVSLTPRSDSAYIRPQADASFSLKNVNVAGIMTPRVVSMSDENGVITKVNAGFCEIGVSEKYLDNPLAPSESQGVSIALVAKRDV